MIESDAGELARCLAAVASPARVALLVRLLGRDRTSGDLARARGNPSPGQVYHHLKELQAAGTVVQVRRGVYRIAPRNLIPLLVILTAAGEVASSRLTEGGEP